MRAARPKLPNRCRFVAFGCTHFPVHDQGAWDWACEVAASVKPHIVLHAGDLFEADAASAHPPDEEYEYDWFDELEATDQRLAQMKDATPDAWRVVVEGNHDGRFSTRKSVPKGYRRACSYRVRQYNEAEKWINQTLMEDWHWGAKYLNDHRGVFRVGQISVAHGWSSAKNGDLAEAIRFGCPNGLHIRAHTHRPTDVTRCVAGAHTLDRWFVNTGTLRDLDPFYARQWDKSKWGHAIVVGELDPRAGPGKSLRAKPCWSAHTVVRCLYDGWIKGEFEPPVRYREAVR